MQSEHSRPSRSPRLSLQQNFSWTFVGNIVYAASRWGILVVLAKMGSPEMVGQFTLSLAITAPVIMFTNLQLKAVQATDANRLFCFGDYLGLRILATGLALLVITGLALGGGHRWNLVLIILMMGIAKALESLSDIFYGLIQQHERMDQISKSLMIKGPLSLVLLGVGIVLTHNVLGGVTGIVIAWVMVLIGYDIPSSVQVAQSRISDNSPHQPIHFEFQPRYHPAVLWKLTWLALPLGVVMMLISLNANVPQYFIEWYLGEHDLGIFAAISYLMVAAGIVVNALGESASPRLAKYYAECNVNAFRSLLFRLIGIGILLGCAGVLIALMAGSPILTILYSPEYALHTDLLVGLMIVCSVNNVASFLGYGMTAARYFRVQTPLFMVVAGSAAFVCWWLMPSYGLQGAVIALLVSASVQALFSLGVIIYAIRRIQGA
jgi:O-antigen/teichoic acid export membrane protein